MNVLLPHQAVAVEWLVAHIRGGLWDEQGLGKTICVIVAADQLQCARILVIAPGSVAFNWQREFGRWSPRRRAQVITSSAQRFDPVASVVIVTHGMLLRPAILDQMRGFDLIVLDEGHMMRNASAKRSAAFYLGADAVCRRSPRSWVLTGTPMANHPGELWTTLAGLDPERLRHEGKLLSLARFKDRFCVQVPSGFGRGMKVVGVKNAPELRQRLQGFALRRLKSDVLKDLPEKRWGTVALAGSVPYVEPLFYDPGRGDDLLEDVKRSDSFAAWRHECGLAKVGPAVEVLEGDLDSGMQKVVIFAHHLDVLEGLREGLAAYQPVVLTGSVGNAERQRLVDRFQADPRCRVFIAQLTAGGVGITLTAASDAVFVEMSFIPGDNAQAVDRLHRIGQKNPVLARFFALAGSIDEILVEIVSRKTQMIQAVLHDA